MKRRSSIVASCVAVFFAFTACGTDVNESEYAADSHIQAFAAPPGGVTATASSQPTAEEPNMTEAGDGAGGATDPTAFGKRCYATCSVVSVGATSCPPNISGFGSTSFLGGCNKACRKAQGDAASKLPAGCAINACNFSGC